MSQSLRKDLYFKVAYWDLAVEYAEALNGKAEEWRTKTAFLEQDTKDLLDSTK